MATPPYSLPDKASLRAFIAASDGPVKTREIARHFGVPPQGRSRLRALLHELAVTGAGGADTENEARFPEVTVADIKSFDSDGYGKITFVHGVDEAGQAIHHDAVLKPAKKTGRSPKIGDRVLVRLIVQPDETLDAETIRILPARMKRFFGRAFKSRKDWMLEPAEKGGQRAVTLRLPAGSIVNENDLIEAELMNSSGRESSASMIRNMGPIDSPKAFTGLAIAEFSLRHEFDEDALSLANGAAVPPLGDRTDLREVPLITIDGEDAKDFDDAVFAAPHKNGAWRLIVAIADVAAYVPSDSPLDKEARLRGNSVYLPGTVIPMLPEALSNGVCSLRPDEDRACLAVEMIISAEGHKQSHKFMRGLMRSHARLTYTQVQQVIDGQIDESDLSVPAGILHHLLGAYRCLSVARAARGTLNLDVPERRIVFSKDGRAEAAVLRRQQEANQLIEEFMIAANICAAEQIEAKRGICVYRVHDQPDPEKIEGLRELTDALELPFAPGQVITPARFNELLNRVKDTPAQTAVNEAVLRCQSRAVYDIENLGHYGLGLVKYGHFTSPIRRYADLMVHRALITGEALGHERPHSQSADVLAETCAAISQTEQNAARAERRTTKRLAASLVSHRLNSLIDVTILGVIGAGLFVLLDDRVTEGFVPRRTLPDDYYEIVSGGMMLVGKRSGWQFGVGDTLSCLLTEISAASGDVTLNFRNGGTQTVGDNKPRKGRRKRPTSSRKPSSKPAPKPSGTSRRALKRRPG